MNKDDCTNLQRTIKEMEHDFHGHVRELRKDFSQHAEDFNTHVAHFREHETEEIERHQESVESQKANTAAINHLVDQMKVQSEDTKGIIETWKLAMGFAKGISWIRKGALWLAGTIITVGSAIFTLTKLGWV